MDTFHKKCRCLPADAPVEGPRVNVQGSPDNWVVQVEGGRCGIGAWWIQMHRQGQRSQFPKFLKMESKVKKKGKMGTGVNNIVVIIITWCLMVRQYTPGSNVWSSGA